MKGLVCWDRFIRTVFGCWWITLKDLNLSILEKLWSKLTLHGNLLSYWRAQHLWKLHSIKGFHYLFVHIPMLWSTFLQLNCLLIRLNLSFKSIPQRKFYVKFFIGFIIQILIRNLNSKHKLVFSFDSGCNIEYIDGHIDGV